MRLGFTGTRNGMTEKQKNRFDELINELKPTLFLHGACLGADEQAAIICNSKNIELEAFPCTLKDWVSSQALKISNIVNPNAPPLERNRSIVDNSKFIVACPESGEVARSGTWSTIRYARNCSKRIYIIDTEGNLEIDE